MVTLISFIGFIFFLLKRWMILFSDFVTLFRSLTSFSCLLLLQHPQAPRGPVYFQKRCFPKTTATVLMHFISLFFLFCVSGWSRSCLSNKGCTSQPFAIISDLLLFLSIFDRRKGNVYGRKKIKFIEGR